MEEETKKSIEELQTVIHEMGLSIVEIKKENVTPLDRYKKLVIDKEAYLSEFLSIETKEKAVTDNLSNIETTESVSIFSAKDEETGKSSFTNETMRKSELATRLSTNGIYLEQKTDHAELIFRKKNLLNKQSVNRSWRKYYELQIISEKGN